jgi:hypothetical protein
LFTASTSEETLAVTASGSAATETVTGVLSSLDTVIVAPARTPSNTLLAEETVYAVVVAVSLPTFSSAFWPVLVGVKVLFPAREKPAAAPDLPALTWRAN